MSAHRLTSHVLYSDPFTEFSGTPQLEYDTIEIALSHLLEARWQLFETVNQAQGIPEQDISEQGIPEQGIPEQDPNYGVYKHTTADTHVPAPYQHRQANLRGNVMLSWRSSNSYLEHALAELAEQPLEHQAINLNTLLNNIIDTLDSNTHTNLFGVDIGLATTLPVVTAPLQLLHWIFSELLITSWFNSLPVGLATSYTSPQVSLQEIATIAISCLDADDAWHITVSSDHHHTSLVTASLTQLKGALQQFGGDVYVASEDDALLQTVVLPKHPRVSH
jgi:hypothetical protein